jgi:hypothetical protein
MRPDRAGVAHRRREGQAPRAGVEESQDIGCMINAWGWITGTGRMKISLTTKDATEAVRVYSLGYVLIMVILRSGDAIRI